MDALADPMRMVIANGLAILAVLLLGAADVYHFVTGPQRAHAEAAQATADANAATGAVQAARDALKITVDTQALHGRIDVATKESTDAIRNSPGASAPVDPALHATGLRALCVYDAHHDSVQCHAMLDADPEQPAR
jgi:hypothetical protein